MIARIAIARMVAVLFPAARIARSSLDMAFGVRADPDVGPGRWDHQPIDAAAHCGVADPPAAGVEEYPALARAPTGDARHAIGHIIESGTTGRLAMLYSAR